MAGFTDQFERRVIPRWHDSQDGVLHKESMSLRAAASSFAPDTQVIREELERTRSLGVAVDALNVGIAAGDQAIAELAARIIDEHRSGLPVPVTEMADRVLGRPTNELPILMPFLQRHGSSIHKLRRLLRVYPRSPLLHLDLARHLVTIGHSEKAKKPIAAAMTLAPNNRTILRATARFLANAGKTDEAYRLIRDAPVTKHDPWLIAAEIALSELVERDPHHWRAGRDFLERAAVAPIHLSELATAVGTVELLSGNKKQARKFFSQGLSHATENSLAQIRWAERRTGTIMVGEGMATTPERTRAFEAEFLRHYNSADMVKAAECGQYWVDSEPFSATPASAMAHVAGLLDDYDTAERFASLGLIAHPDEPSLQNNFVYAHISSGKIFDAPTPEAIEHNVRNLVRTLRTYIEKGGWDGVHAMANLGLLAFRIGQVDDGKLLYERTIQLAQKAQQPQQAATAAVFFAREALLAGVPWASTVLESAQKLAKPFATNPGNAPSVGFYLRKIEALAKDPDRAGHILSVRSADEFLPVKSKRPQVSLKVARKPDGRLIVWVPPSSAR